MVDSSHRSPPLLNPFALFGLDPNSKDDDEEFIKKYNHAVRRAQLVAHLGRWHLLPEEARNALPCNLSAVLNTAADRIQELLGREPALGRSRWRAVRNVFARGELCYFWNPLAARNLLELLRPPPGEGIARLYARTLDTSLPKIQASAA